MYVQQRRKKKCEIAILFSIKFALDNYDWIRAHDDNNFDFCVSGMVDRPASSMIVTKVNEEKIVNNRKMK